MRGYISLLRPINCLIAALAILVGAIVAVGIEGLSSAALQLVMAVLAGISFTGAGNTLNDYFDREVDRINHPARPIPSGRVTASDAMKFAAFLFALALVTGFFAGSLPFLIVIINLALMVSYEQRYKRKGLSGNAMIGWLVASLFIFGGLTTFGGNGQALYRIAWLGFLAFTATLAREIVKDIEDVAGDVNRLTLPKIIGIEKAGFVSSSFFILAVAVSPLPFTMLILDPLYLPVVMLADGIFIYCAWFSTQEPRLVSRVAKYGMVIALVAFLAGGIL